MMAMMPRLRMQIVASMLSNSTAPGSNGTVAESAELLVDLVSYIVANGYLLVDYDGKPTRWGDW